MKDQTSSYLMVSDIPEDDTVGIIFGPFCAQRHAYIFFALMHLVFSVMSFTESKDSMAATILAGVCKGRLRIRSM